MTFSGKTVWVTGASGGIGEGVAVAFAEAGAKVIVSARNEEKLKAVALRCAEAGGEAAVLPLDISLHDAMQEKAAEAEKFFGPIDILVNNAGISQRGRALETGLDIVRKIMETNFLGTVALTKAVLPGMIERDSGHIVTVSSVLGKFGAPTRSAYSASKHALHGFFDSLRAEIYPSKVKIAMICPGYIKTDVSKNALSADGTPHGQLDRGQASGLSPEECAKRILVAVGKGKSEQYIGGTECGGCYLKRFFPSIMERVIRKARVD